MRALLLCVIAPAMLALLTACGGGRDDNYPDDYVRALDKGWRLAPVGVEDEHGIHWGSAQRAKTVTLAVDLSNAAFKQAWLGRRTYALLSGAELAIELPVAAEERYYFLRVNNAEGESLAFAAPVWIGPQ